MSSLEYFKTWNQNRYSLESIIINKNGTTLFSRSRVKTIIKSRLYLLVPNIAPARTVLHSLSHSNKQGKEKTSKKTAFRIVKKIRTFLVGKLR